MAEADARLVAAVLTWSGLAAIVVAAFTFTAQTSYPGSLVAIPVLGAALVIAGGVVGTPPGRRAAAAGSGPSSGSASAPTRSISGTGRF